MVTMDYWKDGLIRKINDPGSVCYKDDLMAIIVDAYPKSRYHYLALPFDPQLDTLADLNGSHVNLIRHMEMKSKIWTGQFVQKDKYGFKFGFHVRPSMNRLHLHLISADHDSIHLFHYEQFNAFKGDFFVSPEKVIDDLMKFGKVNLPTSDQIDCLLCQQLVCHFCGKSFDSLDNFDEFKSHLKLHYNQVDSQL